MIEMKERKTGPLFDLIYKISDEDSVYDDTIFGGVITFDWHNRDLHVVIEPHKIYCYPVHFTTATVPLQIYLEACIMGLDQDKTIVDRLHAMVNLPDPVPDNMILPIVEKYCRHHKLITKLLRIKKEIDLDPLVDPFIPHVDTVDKKVLLEWYAKAYAKTRV